MGLPKSCLNQAFYVLKFWELWNSSLKRKTSLNRKFTVFESCLPFDQNLEDLCYKVAFDKKKLGVGI